MILVLGSASVKVGICGESLPSVVFPTVVGIPAKRTALLKKKTIESNEPTKSHFIGHEAIHNINRASLTYPVEHGIVQHWPSMEHILNHSFEELELTPREWGVLEYLLTRAGQVVSKEQMLQALCSWDDSLTHNAIEVYISRLRAKLQSAGIRIRTVRGFGYVVEEPAA